MISESHWTEPAKILVIEDERHIARFLEFVLQKAGYEVVVAYNGAQALAAAEPFEPDAILLDMVLPGMSGLEILRRLRADPRQERTIIMVLSGRSFGDLPSEVMEAGANAHCTKPIAPSTLLKKLLDLGVPPTTEKPLRAPLPDEVGDGSP
jgi:two-component system response regulator ArlR